ncbi:hypothetical protein ACWGDS_45245 [Streptomyces sp. NPDC055059]
MSQSANFTGYTVDRGSGACFPEPSALPLPVVPAKPTTTKAMVARTLISRRAPAAHRECSRTFVPFARTYSLTCTTGCSPVHPARPSRTGPTRKAFATDTLVHAHSPRRVTVQVPAGEPTPATLRVVVRAHRMCKSLDIPLSLTGATTAARRLFATNTA